MAESQISHSIKQFIHGAVTQKQHQLVPLRRDPSKGTPRLLHPHSLSHMQILLLLMSLCSCCVSQCPFTWLAQPKHWHFMASCLRFPLTAPSISQSAACKLSYVLLTNHFSPGHSPVHAIPGCVSPPRLLLGYLIKTPSLIKLKHW